MGFEPMPSSKLATFSEWWSFYIWTTFTSLTNFLHKLVAINYFKQTQLPPIFTPLNYSNHKTFHSIFIERKNPHSISQLMLRFIHNNTTLVDWKIKQQWNNNSKCSYIKSSKVKLLCWTNTSLSNAYSFLFTNNALIF